jgi:hypothetical protein
LTVTCNILWIGGGGGDVAEYTYYCLLSRMSGGVNCASFNNFLQEYRPLFWNSYFQCEFLWDPCEGTSGLSGLYLRWWSTITYFIQSRNTRKVITLAWPIWSYDRSAGTSSSSFEEQRKSFYERDKSLSHKFQIWHL